MAEQLPTLSYATPRVRRPLSSMQRSDRPFGVIQLFVALVLLLAATFFTVLYTFSEGSWFSKLAWFWLSTGAVVLNAVAAVTAMLGTVRSRAEQQRYYRRYAWACVVGLALAWLCVPVLDRWPPYISDHPSAPAVNDQQIRVGPDLYWRMPLTFLACNPILILMAVRGVTSALSRATAATRSPLDVGYITPRQAISTDEIVAAVREGRERDYRFGPAQPSPLDVPGVRMDATPDEITRTIHKDRDRE